MVRRIDLTQNSFKANGKEFLIQYDQMSVGRYQPYEKLGVELGFGVSYQDIFGTLLEIQKALTSGNNLLESHHKAVSLCMNQMSAIKEQGDDNIPAQVMFCTLFCNYPGEDLSTWNKDIAMQKINDWKAEGIAAIDFFHLAANMLRGYQESLNLLMAVSPSLNLKIPSLTTITGSTPKKTASGKKADSKTG